MSSAPSGWQNPKTNWNSANVPLPTDFNRIEGNIQAIELGSRTVDQSSTPSGNSGTLRQFLSWFANRLKAITGAANWYDAPATTLAAAKSHIDATSGIHGATSSVTANRIIIRDSAGRAKVAAPSASDDIATKGYVDGEVGEFIKWINHGNSIILESTGEVRGEPSSGGVVRVGLKRFRVRYPGLYRVTADLRSNVNAVTAIMEVRVGPSIFRVTRSSTSYGAVTIDIPIAVGAGGTIEVRIYGNTYVGDDGYPEYSTGYIRNVRIRGDFSTVLPTNAVLESTSLKGTETVTY